MMAVGLVGLIHGGIHVVRSDDAVIRVGHRYVLHCVEISTKQLVRSMIELIDRSNRFVWQKDDKFLN
uniref:Putative secreted protein n=1 Tax=Anopheles marajoara TaxID=58244 RepID=A0A2M4CFV8_9DIPT